MIDKAHIKKIADSQKLQLGAEIHVDHVGCSAGRDTKARLYIKRVAGGVLGYCHHCTKSAFARETNTDGTLLRDWLYGKTEQYPEKIARDFSIALSLGKVTAPQNVAWLNKHHILDIPHLYFGEYIDKRLVFNIFNKNGALAGEQSRSFVAPKTGPKYLTSLSGSTCDVAWFGPDTMNQILIITEDYTSAYRVFRHTSVRVMALLRTSMSKITQEHVKELNPKAIWIWLDADEAGQKGAKVLANRLKFILPTTTTIKLKKPSPEPKQLSNEDLMEHLSGAEQWTTI